MSTKDNEPQVKKHIILIDYIFNLLPPAGSRPHPLRVHGVVSLARPLVFEKLPQILTLGLNLSVFQRSHPRETRKNWSNNGGVQVEGISGEQFSEAEISLGNSDLDPCPNFKYQVDRLSPL